MLGSTLILFVLLGQPADDGAAEQPLTKLPDLLQYVDAPYPPEAQSLGLEASVTLGLDVDAEGVVQRVELLEPAGFGFDEAAMTAAAGFVFSPAEAGPLGPVPVRITYRYEFTFREVVATATAADEAPGLAPINLVGTVREMGTRAPIPFAEVFAETVGSATVASVVLTSTEADSAGRFALRGLPEGTTQVRIKAPFFVTETVTEGLAASEVLEVVYFLARKARDPYLVVVKAKAPRKEVARRSLVLKEIQRVPGSQGDAVRVIQNMPGVSRTPFGLGTLVVRGARPQDTGGFVDGHQIPVLFHFGGLAGVTSVVNSRALETVEFLPGGFGPEYGLISAGLVDLKTRKARDDRVHGEAQLNTIALVPSEIAVFVEGPVTDNPEHGSFVLSARRSTLDAALSVFTSLADSSIQLAPRYYDYSLRYDVPVADTGFDFTLLTYGSDDELVLIGAEALSGTDSGVDEATRSRGYFHRLNPRLTYRGDGMRFELSPIFGFDFVSLQVPQSGAQQTLRIEGRTYTAGLIAEAEFELASWVDLTIGTDFNFIQFSGESVIPAFSSVRDFPSPIGADRPTRKDRASVPTVAFALYSELELKPFDNFSVWPGVRFQLINFSAADDPLTDPRLVEGQTMLAVDPRLTLLYEPIDGVILKAHAGLYSQPAQPQEVLVNAELPYQVVEQYSLGVEWEIIDRLTLDLQGFLRRGRDITRFSEDLVLTDAGTLRPEGFRPTGESRAYGLEFLLRLEERWGVFGWVAYTLSRSEIRDAQKNEAFRPNFFFDQTHNLNIVAVYEFLLDYFIGIRFRFVTGSGVAATAQRWYDSDLDGYDRDIGDELERAPPFHQLDVYFERRWAFDEWALTFYVDVQNIYNAQNTEFFVPTFDFKDSVGIPGLPIFPSLGLKGEF